jgi:hypothetical protein
VQVFERGGKALETALFQERPDAQLDAGLITDIFMERPAFFAGSRDFILGFIRFVKFVDLRVRDFIDHLDNVADAVAVDRQAEPDLRFHFVAFGDRDFAHVVAEPGDLHGSSCRPTPAAARVQTPMLRCTSASCQ